MTQIKAFTYLSLFVLLFQVLALSELIIGFAYALNDLQHTNFYAIHTFYCITGTILILDYTLKTYYLNKIVSWNLWKFSLAVLPGIVILLALKLLIPDIDPPAHYDFEIIFNKNKLLLYSIMTIYTITVNMLFGVVYKTKNWKKSIILTFPTLIFIFGIIFNSVLLDYGIAIAALTAVISLYFITPTTIKDFNEKL